MFCKPEGRTGLFILHCVQLRKGSLTIMILECTSECTCLMKALLERGEANDESTSIYKDLTA